MSRRRRAASDRFWEKVSGGPASECWIWQSAVKPDGYGDFWFDGRRVAAHRWAYQQMIGPVPEGLQLDHLCRNRACVNPYHLDPVTAVVNTRRGAGPASKTHCPSGHPYDEANTNYYRGRRYCLACRVIHNANRDCRKVAA